MKSYGLTIAAVTVLALSGCMKAQDSTSRALDTVGNETSSSYNKMRDYLDLGHKPKPVPPQRQIPPRYCYKTYEDVLCYSQPIAGEEYRLTGFQTATGKTGYTLPPTVTTPAEAVVAPPPQMVVMPGGNPVSGELPPLKSVTVLSVPPVKAVATPPEARKQMKEVIFDPAEWQPKDLVPPKPE